MQPFPYESRTRCFTVQSVPVYQHSLELYCDIGLVAAVVWKERPLLDAVRRKAQTACKAGELYAMDVGRQRILVPVRQLGEYLVRFAHRDGRTAAEQFRSTPFAREFAREASAHYATLLARLSARMTAVGEARSCIEVAFSETAGEEK